MSKVKTVDWNTCIFERFPVLECQECDTLFMLGMDKEDASNINLTKTQKLKKEDQFYCPACGTRFTKIKSYIDEDD